MTEKYGIYIRVAGEAHIDPAASHQEAILRETVTLLGADLAGVYFDHGKLPTVKEGLPYGIAKACAAGREGTIWHLLMCTPDRLGRNEERFKASHDALVAAGVTPHYLFGPDSPLGASAEEPDDAELGGQLPDASPPFNFGAAIESVVSDRERGDRAARIAAGRQRAAQLREEARAEVLANGPDV